MGILGITDVNTLKHPMRYVRVLMIIATQSWCFGIKENGKGKTRNPILKSLQNQILPYVSASGSITMKLA